MRIMAKFMLPQSNWMNIVENSALVAIAAGLTYLTQNVGQTDFGPYTPIIVAGMTILVTWINNVINNVVPVPPNPAPNPLPNPVPPQPAPPNNGEVDFPVR